MLQSTDVLKNYGLSITEARKQILELFHNNKGALSHGDIERKSPATLDRVTIYRTLQTFLDKGIVHTIPTVDNSVLYALCKDECKQGNHQDNHVHFICSNCGITYCLDEVGVPFVQLPEGFIQEQTDVVLKGICKNCKEYPFNSLFYTMIK